MNYPGGKNQEGLAQWIINQMPPHEVYVEAFAGSAAVMRLKKPASSSIVIERDADVARDLVSMFSAMPAVAVFCGDAISHLRKLRCGPSTLIYVDPPYLMETRRSKQKIYRHEFGSADQHERLLKLLCGLDCMVMISGYRSSLYDAILQGWRRTEKQVTLRYGIKAVECLWMNYPEPVALHDYQYLGNTFRERERFKRIRHNWKKRFATMPVLERRALATALAEIDDGGPHGF